MPLPYPKKPSLKELLPLVALAWMCILVLQSEATPGEDEMNPTVKRSGWHPPEDTGIWAKADQVALEVIYSHCKTTVHAHLRDACDKVEIIS